MSLVLKEPQSTVPLETAFVRCNVNMDLYCCGLPRPWFAVSFCLKVVFGRVLKLLTRRAPEHMMQRRPRSMPLN